MTEEEKIKLIDAVNCKFPHNNIMELYYNIGRALPFTAQRFPDGRVSDWYRSQYTGNTAKLLAFTSEMVNELTVLMLKTYAGAKRTRKNLRRYRIQGVAHGDSWIYKGNPFLKSQNCWGLMMSSTLANTKA